MAHYSNTYEQRKQDRIDRYLERAEKAELQEILGRSGDKLFEPDALGRYGFPDYALTNNNSNIRRMKLRLAELAKMDDRETTEEQHEGVKVVQNAEENRVQLFLDGGKPPEHVRKMLRSMGFRFSRENMAWQRHLNNAGIHAANIMASWLKEHGQEV